MNIFVLDNNPIVAARLQCDKHVVKMIVESAQMLSTAHRVLDGQLSVENVNGRSKKVYKLDSQLGSVLYKVAHANHPCTLWVTESSANYAWLYLHFIALCDEYTYRYDKIHKTDTLLRKPLKAHPKNIKNGLLTPFALAMKAEPQCIVEDSVQSYRNFYKTKKDRFKMAWTKRDAPEWFV
jgi:hypothetical protein